MDFFFCMKIFSCFLIYFVAFYQLIERISIWINVSPRENKLPIVVVVLFQYIFSELT